MSETSETRKGTTQDPPRTGSKGSSPEPPKLRESSTCQDARLETSVGAGQLKPTKQTPGLAIHLVNGACTVEMLLQLEATVDGFRHIDDRGQNPYFTTGYFATGIDSSESSCKIIMQRGFQARGRDLLIKTHALTKGPHLRRLRSHSPGSSRAAAAPAGGVLLSGPCTSLP